MSEEGKVTAVANVGREEENSESPEDAENAGENTAEQSPEESLKDNADKSTEENISWENPASDGEDSSGESNE